MPMRVEGGEGEPRIVKQQVRFGRLRGHLELFSSTLGAAWSILGAILSQLGLSKPFWRSSWAL
eukprot:7119330-Pyramimonas_sp.AAC.1